MSELIRKIHSIVAGKHSDAEIAGWYTAAAGTVAVPRIVAQPKANPTAGQFANGDFKAVLAEAVMKALQSHHSMSDQCSRTRRCLRMLPKPGLDELR